MAQRFRKIEFDYILGDNVVIDQLIQSITEYQEFSTKLSHRLVYFSKLCLDLFLFFDFFYCI